jgi:hypothetical protein
MSLSPVSPALNPYVAGMQCDVLTHFWRHVLYAHVRMTQFVSAGMWSFVVVVRLSHTPLRRGNRAGKRRRLDGRDGIQKAKGPAGDIGTPYFECNGKKPQVSLDW